MQDNSHESGKQPGLGLGASTTGRAPDLERVAGLFALRLAPPLVLVDEFTAIAPTGVARPLACSRSTGPGLLLGTQELADLRPPHNLALADQVLGNVSGDSPTPR